MVLKLLHAVRARFGFEGKPENRRRHRRFSRCTLLTIVPLDEDFSQMGSSIWGMSQDISRGGIGFTLSLIHISEPTRPY